MRHFYSKWLTRRPMLTQAVMTGCLFGTGDIISQSIVEQNRKSTQFSFRRFASLVFFGSAVAGPCMVVWYRFLATRIVIASQPGLQLLLRVALDQLLYAPTFLGIFFVSTSAMQGASRADIMHKLSHTYPDALLSNYALWPAVQLVNFRLVPLQHQTLFVNSIALGWNTYLSHINSQ